MPQLSHTPERRLLRRSPQASSSVLFCPGPAGVVTGQIYDLSAMGIGILTNRYLAVGSIVEIRIPASGGRHRGVVSGEIRNMTARNDGLWVLGCALLRPLTGAEVFALG
jgi:hypothetical protein